MSQSNLSNPTDEAPAVDFVALLGRCLGNFKIVERVITTFRDSGWSDLNQLQEALEQADYQSVVEISHRFKGAASNVSATRLAKLLAQSEQFGKEKDHSELTWILVEIHSEWEAFKQFAQVFAPATNTVKTDSVKKTLAISEIRHARADC